VRKGLFTASVMASERSLWIVALSFSALAHVAGLVFLGSEYSPQQIPQVITIRFIEPESYVEEPYVEKPSVAQPEIAAVSRSKITKKKQSQVIPTTTNTTNPTAAPKNPQPATPLIAPISSANYEEGIEEAQILSSPAQILQQVYPKIPDEMRATNFKAAVRVRVVILHDGNARPELTTSSGNESVDALVLAALKKWRWSPGMIAGAPVSSIRYFRFEFEVR